MQVIMQLIKSSNIVGCKVSEFILEPRRKTGVGRSCVRKVFEGWLTTQVKQTDNF